MKSWILGYPLLLAGVFSATFLAGCGGSAPMALDLQPGDSGNYRVISEKQRGVEFGGALEGQQELEGGMRTSITEMTFTQEIESIDEAGNAVARITIRDISASTQMRDEIVSDYSSDTEGSVFAGLVGKSYKIKIAPTGQVTEVLDTSQIREAIRNHGAEAGQARGLFSNDSLKDFHTVSVLPGENVAVGDSWHSVKTFSFGMLGTKELERIYTLVEVVKVNGQRIAVADLNAIPSAEGSRLLHQQAEDTGFDDMFDTSHDYSGTVKLNLDDGQFVSCIERLNAEWIIVEPTDIDHDDLPGMLSMSANIHNRLERID